MGALRLRKRGVSLDLWMLSVVLDYPDRCRCLVYVYTVYVAQELVLYSYWGKRVSASADVSC